LKSSIVASNSGPSNKGLNLETVFGLFPEKKNADVGKYNMRAAARRTCVHAHALTCTHVYIHLHVEGGKGPNERKSKEVGGHRR
jgi:hypothetical protein